MYPFTYVPTYVCMIEVQLFAIDQLIIYILSAYLCTSLPTYLRTQSTKVRTYLCTSLFTYVPTYIHILGDLPQNNHFITLQIDGQSPNLF
jgi:hypothetical protein